MSVLKSLAREHELLRRLADRMQRAVRYQEPVARAELRAALLILLPALERHEEIERSVFGRPPYASSRQARKILARIEAQHRTLETIRLELKAALSDWEARPIADLKSRGAALAERLLAHFDEEERQLWPSYRLAMSRSLDSSLGRRAGRHVEALEREVALSCDLVSEYLGGTQ